MLNTPRSAHNKIFGAKFSSFERAAIAYWHPADYAAKKRSVQWMTEQNKHYWAAIEPLLHSNSKRIRDAALSIIIHSFTFAHE